MDKTVHVMHNSSGTIISDGYPAKSDPDENPTHPCWWCGGALVWQSDSMKEEWGMPGEGMVSILLCSKCNAEVRYIEAEDEP